MTKWNEIDSEVEAIEGMVRALENVADPALSANAKKLVSALMQMHGACLERMVEIVNATGAVGQSVMESFLRDDKVRSLLLLYDLHPEGLEDRVRTALESTRLFLHSHGGNVELVEVREGAVTLRFEGNCSGCPSSAATLRLAVEKAIYEFAPDVTKIIVQEGAQETLSARGFVSITSLSSGGSTSGVAVDSSHLQRSPR